MEAKLTWVRLNAELKNWRNVGRESLAFLGERRSALARKGAERRLHQSAAGVSNVRPAQSKICIPPELHECVCVLSSGSTGEEEEGVWSLEREEG